LMHIPSNLVVSPDSSQIRAKVGDGAVSHFGPRESMALWLMIETAFNESSWQPYICSLPEKPPQVAFWTPSEVEKYIRKLAVAQFNDPLSDHHLNCSQHFHHFVEEVRKRYHHHATMTSLAAPAESNFYQWFNSSKFVTALGHVQSRTYHSTPSESTLSDHPAVFVPLGDLINDAGYGTRSADATDMCQQANVAFYVNNRTNAFTFYATRNISSGEQIVSYYTDSVYTSCSAEFIGHYGFLPHGCHARIAAMEEDDDNDDDDDDEALPEQKRVSKAPKRKVPVYGHDLVGQRISLFETENGAWYDGTVAKYDPVDDGYHIRYDSGEIINEALDLSYDQKDWRLLKGGLGNTKSTNSKKGQRLHMPRSDAEALVGKRVSIYDYPAKAWFAASVNEYNAETGYHKVAYDDGEIHLEYFNANGEASHETGRWRVQK